MRTGIDIGLAEGAPALLDLQELLATRLLVQGNSGSGKSHLLRRLMEQSAPLVQQAVIDPEGDFVTLAERFGHVVVEADIPERDLARVAARVRQHRVSVVLNLESLDAEGQMRAAAAFLNGLFEAEREHWYPVLVVVDEAQLFAPAVAGEVSDEARRLSLGAMTNLMCRGRKRGLAGVIATQRLAKLAKNVAAEASNFLMGRTFLDIDMARAADLLGMERRQAEMFRDLERGRFVALGPALSKRPLPVSIGPVDTAGRGGSPVLLPLPEAVEDAHGLIFHAGTDEPADFPPAPAARPRASANDVLAQLARHRPAPPAPDEPALPPEERAALEEDLLRETLADPDAATRGVAVLYQDFVGRCRARRLGGEFLTLPEFKRRLAVVRAGVCGEALDPSAWEQAQAQAAALPEDLQGLFLLLARAALEHAPCPDDASLAAAYGTSSAGRARRLLAYLEESGAVVCRTDFRGGRIVAVPSLGAETAPGARAPLQAGAAAPRRHRRA